MLVRRLISIPLLFLTTLGVTVLLPALLILAGVISLAPPFRGALPTLGFLTGYLWSEVLGVLASAWLWLRYRDNAEFLTGNFHLQCWWTDQLMRLAKSFYRLQIHIDGEDALPGPPAIVIPRHTSIADTIIPMVYYAHPQQVRLRYVLKRELLIDPCLDIVGNRLPNYFVDRSGQDGEQAKRGVAELVSTVGEAEGVLIYPEGTRWSARKHAAFKALFADDEALQVQLARWPYLLPPRVGGTVALLQANPGLDILFCAHTGFEGSSHFSNLINGSWIRARIDVRFWRLAYADIPTTPEGLREMLFAQWDTMHGWIVEHQSAR